MLFFVHIPNQLTCDLCGARRQRYVRDEALLVARLQQQYAPVALLRQPIGHHRAAGAGTDDNEIVFAVEATGVRYAAVELIGQVVQQLEDGKLGGRGATNADSTDGEQQQCRQGCANHCVF